MPERPNGRAWRARRPGNGPRRFKSFCLRPKRKEHRMLRGLTSLQLFVDDVGEAERWYTEVLGTGPGGAVSYWQVDDVADAFDRLVSMGAKPLQRPTELSRGFVVASVTDPFGNVLGLRFDPNFGSAGAA